MGAAKDQVRGDQGKVRRQLRTGVGEENGVGARCCDGVVTMAVSTATRWKKLAWGGERKHTQGNIAELSAIDLSAKICGAELGATSGASAAQISTAGTVPRCHNSRRRDALH